MAASTSWKFCSRLGVRQTQNVALHCQPVTSAYCYGLCGSSRHSRYQRNNALRHTTIGNITNYHKLTSSATCNLLLLQRNASNEKLSHYRTASFVPVRDISDQKQPSQVGKVAKLIPIRNPFHAFRDWLYSFLIRVYFDQEFYLSEFGKGAKEAVIYVSQQISKGAFEKVDGLLIDEVSIAMKEKYQSMSADERSNLAISEDDVVYYPHDILVHYDNSGANKIVKVKIRFRCIWGYNAFANADKDMPANERLKKIVHCDYEFHRDFSPGVSPLWVISGIEYSTMGVKKRN